MKTFREMEIDLPEDFSGDRKTTCPKCSHARKKPKDPCLSVNGDKKTWHCFNCGWVGSLYERAEFREQEHRAYRRPAPETVKSNIAPEIVRYFEEGRKISCDTLVKCGVFSTPHYLNGVGREVMCIAFPYYRGTELLNVKYRDGRKNMAQEKGPEPCLWNINSVVEGEPVYLTEGEIDALTLVECGFGSVVSVDKGAPNLKDADATKKLECVVNCMERLQNASGVVLLSDKDEPGLRLEREIIALLGPGKCMLTRYPPDCKDVNDVLVRYGRKAVVDVIRTAQPAPVPGLHGFSEFADDIWKFYRNGTPRGLGTGWPELDRYFTIQPGSLNVVTGIPQSGKSEFVHALMVHMIRNLDWKCAIFSPEMLPVENLFANFAEKIIGKPFFGGGRMTEEEAARALNMCDTAIKVLLPDADKTPTVDELLAAAEVCVVRYGVRAVVFDPYNEIEHTRNQWMTETEYISYFLGRMRKFARQHKIWLCIVAHPTKLKKDERSKKFPVPTLYDISGSANWWNKTDNGLSLWRDYKGTSNEVSVHIQKVKSKGIGRAGTIQHFEWDRRTGRFVAIPDDREEKSSRADDLPPNNRGAVD